MDVDALLLVLQTQHPDINCTTLVARPDEPVRLGAVHPFCELRSVDKWSGNKWERTAHQLQRDELVDSACNWIVVNSGAEDSLFQLLYAKHTELVRVRPAQPSVASSANDERRVIREKQLRLESVGMRLVSAKEFSVQPDQYVWLTYRFVREVFDARGRDSAGVEIFLEQLQLQSPDALGKLLRQYETTKDVPAATLQYVAKWSLRMFLGLKDPDCSPEKAFNFWPVVGEPEAVAYVWVSLFPSSIFRRDFGQSEWQLLIAGRDYEYRPDTAQYTIGSWLMVAADQPCSIRLRFADGSTMLRRLIPALPSEISVEEAERIRRFRLEMYDIWRLMSLGIRSFSKRVESLVKPPFLWRAYCLAFSLYQEEDVQRSPVFGRNADVGGEMADRREGVLGRPVWHCRPNERRIFVGPVLTSGSVVLGFAGVHWRARRNKRMMYLSKICLSTQRLRVPLKRPKDLPAGASAGRVRNACRPLERFQGA